jgi:IS1 family transposase
MTGDGAAGCDKGNCRLSVLIRHTRQGNRGRSRVANRDEEYPQLIDWEPLLAPVPPWAHLLACEAGELDRAVGRFKSLHPRRHDVIVRIMRGYRSRTKSELLSEWAAALQFPWYFGHNWDAFHECIRDMAWLSASSYVYVIEQSDMLLKREAHRLTTQIEIFASSAVEWAEYGEGGPQWRRNTLFHVVFQCKPALADATRDRLAAAGAQLNDIVYLKGAEDASG